MKDSELRKLTRILGMLGSDHAGERASAALAADRLVRGMRTTWWDQLSPPGEQRINVVRTIHEWGIDHATAAEARQRQLRDEIERLRRENAKLRGLLGVGARRI